MPDDLAISINPLANWLNPFAARPDDPESSINPANPQFYPKRLDENAHRFNLFTRHHSINNSRIPGVALCVNTGLTPHGDGGVSASIMERILAIYDLTDVPTGIWSQTMSSPSDKINPNNPTCRVS